MEIKTLCSAPEFLAMARKSAAKNEEAFKKPELGKTIKLKLKKSSTENSEPVSKLIEKLRSYKNLSGEEFKRVFEHKSEETAELYKILGVQLPLVSDDTLIHAINFANSQVKNAWAFRAQCVAELFKRCPRHLGGRSQKAKDDEGRGNLVKLLAEKFNTSQTNIRLDELIHRRFNKLTEIKTSADSAEVLTEIEIEADEFSITRSEDNQYFTDFIEHSKRKPNTINVHSFIPHPKLTREHYAVAVRLNAPWSRAAIEEAITEVEAGNTYTASDMKKKYFPRKQDYPRHIKLYYSDLPKETVKLEVSFDELDAQVLCTALAKGLGLKPLEIMKSSSGEIMLEKKGFDCIMEILKKYIESN